MASDFKKPHGITMVPFGYEMDWIDTIPIDAVPGVGHATHKRLTELGVVTCGDICKLSLGLLHTLFGQVHGTFLWNLAHGRDERPLSKRGPGVHARPKSISHQSTLQNTTSDKDYVESILLYIAERCLWRLRAARMRTRGISIFMRFAEEGATRSYGGFSVGASAGHAGRTMHFKQGVQSEQIVLPIVANMTREIWRAHPRPRIDFVGVRLFDFQPVREQEELFVNDAVKKETLSRVLGNIREKFGPKIVTSARTFTLHHSYRLSQAGLSFSVQSIEEEGSAEMTKRHSEGYHSIESVL